MTEKNKLLFAMISTCTVLSGCVSAPPSAAPTPTGLPKAATPEPPEQPSEPVPPINLTPLSTYEDQWIGGVPAGGSFANSYTKVILVGDLVADKKNGVESKNQPESLKYQKRWWLSRALLGQEFSINLTAKVTVGSFEATFPLATIGHQSNSDGEQWQRVIHHSMSHSPLFLVRSDGSASVPIVKLSVNGTNSYASRGAAAAIQTALGVARATSQPATVITRLSEQSTKDQARAVDAAISKLFGSGIAEEHWSDRDLRAWRVSEKNEPLGVRVTFNIPRNEGDWDSELREVGTWTITFDYPRPSIFADWRICATDEIPRCVTSREKAEKEVHKEINPSQVLSYALVDGNQGLGTIRAYLSQQDWYTSAQAEMVNPAMNEATVSSLCRRIRNEITGLGLNGFDAAIVVWAVARGMPMPTGAPDFTTIKDCESSIVAIEKDRP